MYHGYRGGLYANGKNTPPQAYLRQGIALGKSVKPIDGKIVLLSIGLSNTTMEFGEFKRLVDTDTRKNAAVTLVDGAKGGQDANIITSTKAGEWYLYGGTLSVAAGMVASFIGAARWAGRR